MGWLGVIWGLSGVSLILIFAIVRLSPIAWDALWMPLTWYHWSILILNILFMAYTEGYRGFQQAFSPRAVARARYLVEHPSRVHTLLAPFFLMGYYFSTPRRQWAAWALTAAIIVLIVIVHALSQPWRGIIDAGVVVGLIWGLASLYYFVFVAFTGRDFKVSPELPAWVSMADDRQA